MKSKIKILSLSCLFLFHFNSYAEKINENNYLYKISNQKYNLYEDILKSTKEIDSQQKNNNDYRVINCWDEAGKKYNLDPWLIFAYAQTESTLNPNAVNKNKSSIDRGIMQINSFWLPTLEKYNIKVNDLFDSCVSIFIGSWIIRQNIDRYGYNYNGLVAYNVGNPFDSNKKQVGLNYYNKLLINYYKMKNKYALK